MSNEKVVQVFSYKDESPANTVKRIKGILQAYHVKTTETWWDTGAPHCYIVSIRVDGTNFRTTGKGLTKELALASGYGELMERFQLGYIGRADVQKDGVLSTNDTQTEIVDAKTLLERNRKWYALMSDRLQHYVGNKYSPEDILMQYADQDGNVLCTPYYCITTDSKEYLPLALRKAAYTASGCASGNTVEEAIVHALSEIVERYCLVKIASDNLSLPDIPETVLREFTYAYSIITHLRQHGYKVIVKDCSLGNKYPTVCVCFINQTDGRYHTHYGADPVLEIAIERALVEPFQGRNMETLAKHEDFAEKTVKHLDVKNLEKEIVWGAAEKPFSFFTGTPFCEYNENVGFSGKNNRELLNECVSYFKEMGYDILVRDSSCLSFPTVQVIIPGYSEVTCHRISPDYEYDRPADHVAKALKDLSKASVDDLVLTLIHMMQNQDAFSKMARLHLTTDKKLENYLRVSALAYINYSLMRHLETVKCIDVLLRSEKTAYDDYLLCLKRYLLLQKEQHTPEESRRILEFFHRSDTVEKLFSYIGRNANPLDDYVVHCDGKCSNACSLQQYCCKKYVSSLVKLVNEKTSELDFLAFSNKIRDLLA